MTSSLGLRGNTVSALQAFKKRNEDARRKVQLLSEQATTVDFAHYRSNLKNQAVVEEIEKRFTAFKPASYDVNRQLKAIDAFEVEAVKNAEATKQAVDLELKDLAATLKNIEEARAFEDLTVVCLCPGRDDGGVCVVVARMGADEIFNRTKLLPPRSPSTRRLPSSFPRADGWSLDTRYVFCPVAVKPRPIADPPTGEVRRPRPCIISLRCPALQPYSFPLCILAL